MYKIVIADDDTNFLKQFERATDWEKYDMEIVGRFDDGAQIIEYIKKNSVDCIITDIAMPEVNGVEVARYVYENNPNIKVMFFSAFKSFKYATEALDYGVIGYIPKPISVDTLYKNLDKLEKILKKKYSANFMNDTLVKKRINFIVEFLRGRETHETVTIKLFDGVNVPYRSLYMKCAVVTFTISDFEHYLENVWKYGKRSFYEAIERIVCNEDDDVICIPFNIAEGDITVCIISKNGNANLNACIGEIKTKIYDMFSVAVSVNGYEITKSVQDMRKAIHDNKTEYLTTINHMIASKMNDYDIESYKAKIKTYIELNCMRDLSRDEVAEQMHMNITAFSRFFKENFDEKFIDYVNRVKVEKAKEMIIKDNGCNVIDLYKSVGYKSKTHFYKIFKYYTGKTPLEYKKEVLLMKNYENR